MQSDCLLDFGPKRLISIALWREMGQWVTGSSVQWVTSTSDPFCSGFGLIFRNYLMTSVERCNAYSNTLFLFLTGRVVIQGCSRSPWLQGGCNRFVGKVRAAGGDSEK